MSDIDDDIDHADLFGEDSSNDGDAPSSSKAGVGKKQSVDCPRYPKIQSDGKMYFSRIATVFGVQPAPFHVSSYTGADQEPSVKVDDFGQAKVRAAPIHVIRWRYSRNNKGQQVKQSNTKLVRWSDGTMCLYVGEERFVVSENALPVPYRLATASEDILQTQGELTSRMMFQPTSKAAAKRGAIRAGPVSDEPVVITSQAQAELKKRMEAEDEVSRMNQQAARKRRGGPGGSFSGSLDADFLEEGTDIGATKAHFKNQAALAREKAHSKRLTEIKEGRKKKKLQEHEEESEDDSFIASEGEPSEEDFSDEE